MDSNSLSPPYSSPKHQHFDKGTLAASPFSGSLFSVNLPNSITSLPETAVPAESTIIAEGTAPERIYFLKSGKIEVRRDETRLSIIKTPGSVVGEMAFLLNANATASVITLTDCVFHVAEDPYAFLDEHPRACLKLARLLAHRLDAASQYLVDVKSQLTDCSDHVGMVDGVLDSILHRDLKSKVAD